MKTIAIIWLMSIQALWAGAQTNWEVDHAHTSVNFSVTHMVISEVHGKFEKFTGSVQSATDDFTDANIHFTVDANSINTDNEMRDKHLRGDDFFNAEKYPNLTFNSSSLKKLSGNKYQLTGELTIRDVTRTVTFEVTYNGTVKDPWGNTRAGFKATTVINRFDYHLKWNNLADAGPVVGSDVTITINIELVKK